MAPIAKAHACSPARISLSWLLAKPVVTSVIIGAKRLDQLEENLAAVEVQLTEDALKLLDQVSALRPNIPVGCSPLTAPAVWESLTVLFGTICVSLRARHSDYAERLVLKNALVMTGLANFRVVGAETIQERWGCGKPHRIIVNPEIIAGSALVRVREGWQFFAELLLNYTLQMRVCRSQLENA
jgi:hypothetical protein